MTLLNKSIKITPVSHYLIFIHLSIKVGFSFVLFWTF